MESGGSASSGHSPGAEDERRKTSTWLSSAAGAVLIIGVLYLGRDVLIPLAIAILLSFLLSPIVTFLARIRVPRIPGVILTATMAFALIGAFSLLVGTQATQLARDLPSYQVNIVEKLRTFREASPSGGVVDRLTGMFQDLREEVEADEAEVEAQEFPIVEIREPAPSAIAVARDMIGPLIGPIGKAGLVIVLVIFILLEREDLRNRLIRLVGPNMQVTTEAMDEAGYRVSRYLLMQLVVNVTYGIPFGIGLYFIGIPNAALWAVLAVMLRFIPYLGPVLSAAFPLLLAVAVDPGWTTLLLTLGLILVLELVSNNFIEPWLYGASTSISAVAIILAAIFWTTLWGPIGLLLATPMTVCLAVIGRYFPSMRFLDVMLGSAPALALHERFYQRLLAGDVDENLRIADDYLEKQPIEALYDEVALPALALAAEDNLRGRLSRERRHIVMRSALRLVNELADHDPDRENGSAEPAAAADGRPFSVLCAAGRSPLDLPAATMLAQLLELRGFETRVVTAEAVSPEHLSSCHVENFDAVFLSCIEGAAASRRIEQTCRRLARRAPKQTLLVGIWNAAERIAESGRPPQLPDGAQTVGTLREALAAIESLADARGKPYEAPEVPNDEAERLMEIQRLKALKARSPHLDELTHRLAESFGVPISLLNIVDEDSQHWRAQTGLPEELERAGESPRDTSICGHVVAKNELMIIEDVLQDSRFAKNPFLLEHGIRFYAGAPLMSRNGYSIGSLCVIDAMPRAVTDEQRALLLQTAEEAMSELEALAAADDAGTENPGQAPSSTARG